MKYYVISLKRTPERLEQFMSLNQCQDKVEVFEAIDGKKLTWASLEKCGIVRDPLQYYSSGGLGSATSQYILWQRANLFNETITIFEDDAILHRDFFEKTEHIIRSTTAQWDFIQWGWNFDACMEFQLPGNLSICNSSYSQDSLRSKTDIFRQQDANPDLYRLHTSFGFMAYTISPAGARRLLKGCFPLVEKSIHIPSYYRNVLTAALDMAAVECHRQKESKSYVCFPPLAISKNEHEISTIVDSGSLSS